MSVTEILPKSNRSIYQGAVKLGLVLGVTTTTWNAKTGGLSKTIYTGTQTQVKSLGLNCQQDGLEYAIIGGHKWTIEVTFPLDIVVNDTNKEPNPVTGWELNNTPIEQNIFELKDRQMIGSLSSDIKKNIELNLKNPFANILPALPGSSIPIIVNAQITQNLKFAGVEGKLLFVPTLKRTVIVSNEFNPKNIGWTSDTNGKVMTTETLVNKYGTITANNNNPLSALPDFLSFVLPISLPLTAPNFATGGTTTVNQIGFVDPGFIGPDGMVTFVGWLEYPPEYQIISIQKIQVSQSWVFNRWSAGNWGLYDSFPLSQGPYSTVQIIG